jgi:hypothetical protein
MMSPSPEIDAMKAQMTAIIVRDSEGFFDNLKESEDLQISVRIACEFFVFLKQSSETPELIEAAYMAGTIRSGLDWFVSMAQTGRMAGLELQSGLDSQFPRAFPELKTSYDLAFRQALESKRSTEALGLFLALLQMMLLFLAAYFPSI